MLASALIDQIDWVTLESGTVSVPPRCPLLPGLLRKFYESPELDTRREALFDASLAVKGQPSGLFHPPAPELILCLAPALFNESDPLLDELLRVLNSFQWDAFDPLPTAGQPELAAKVLSAIGECYSAVLFLTQVKPEWRLRHAGLLTSVADRSEDYLPFLLKEYQTQIEPLDRSHLLALLSRVRQVIPGWSGMLRDAVEPGVDQPLRFVAATELAVLLGDDSPPALIEIIGDTPLEVCRPPKNEMMLPSYSHAWQLGKALRAMPRRRRIELLMRSIHIEGDDLVSVCLAGNLFEAVAGETRLVLPLIWGGPDRTFQFCWACDADNHDWYRDSPPRTLLVTQDDPDWLGSLLRAPGLRDPYRELGDAQWIRTNLFAMFGLPNDREGLIRVWEAVHGRAWNE